MTRKIKTSTDQSAKLKGRIVAFDANTWWGEVCYDLTTFPFHGTSYRGLTTNNLPKVGDPVTIILNQAGRLLSVEYRKL